jgi:uncharacterized phage protein gp47/JayE
MTPPTTAEVSENAVAQLEASLEQTIPILPKSFNRVLAKVLAGVAVILYKYAGWIFLQLFVAHASASWVTVLGRRFRPLVEWGRLVGLGDPQPAQPTELTVAVTVLVQSGDLKTGTSLVRSDTQVIYQVLSPVALNAPTVQVRVRAVAGPGGSDGAGTVGNAPDGTVLEFANTPPNVGPQATVVTTVVQGTDAEDIETSYRPRVLRRFQEVPQGGAYADYRIWAEGVTGIIHAYPYKGAPGEVDVYVEADPVSSGSADGIPTGAQLTAVGDAIQLANRRPVGAAVNVLAITRTAYAVQITGLSPATAEMKALVEQGMDQHLRSREPYIDGLSVLPKIDRITTAALGGVVEQIVAAEGGQVSQITLVGGPVVTLGHGVKAKLGTVTYL